MRLSRAPFSSASESTPSPGYEGQARNMQNKRDLAGNRINSLAGELQSAVRPLWEWGVPPGGFGEG